MAFYLKKIVQGPYWFGQVYLTGPFKTHEKVQQLLEMHVIWDRDENLHYTYEVIEE